MPTRVANESLAEAMDRQTVVGDPALWWAEGDRLRCVACGHRCLIGEGLRGICKVRLNDRGQLKVPFGYVAGLQCDPVEKKPFFHVYPGSDALTFGMLGCDLHCSYCQNWVTSQALRDQAAVAPLRPVTAGQLVDLATREGARLVVSSYNEPLITAEWAVSVFRQAKAAGLACAFVSNGNGTPEVLDFLRPWISAYKVDLKSFNDRTYRGLGGTLDNILRTIEMVHERGLWLEVVTLVIPGLNDSEDELRQAARFLASVSRDIPWHVTAFHKDYRMTDPEATSAATLIRAAEIGAAEGLRFVYAGNLPGRVGSWEDTRCPSCSYTLIQRFGYLVRTYRIGPDGRCPQCQAAVPGVWPGATEGVITGNDLAAYRSRLPRLVQLGGGAARAGGQESGVGDQTSEVKDRQLRAQRSEVTDKNGRGGRLMLSEEHKQRLLEAAGLMLRANVEGREASFPAELADIANEPVAGAFVSLKRGGHLRSCCGLLGQPVPLYHAVAHAAHRTAVDDVRFPPISPSELDYLDIEVWLLASPQPVHARGEDRRSAILIGRHGIQVVQGQASGLFLPSVAVDNNWDATQFLDHVCVKAGLPPTAWRDDATSLFTFEGEALRGRLAGPGSSKPVERARAFFRPEDLPVYGAFCRSNLLALLTGSTPSYYLGGAPDGNVSGVILTVHLGENGQAFHLTQLSLRPGVPLQATLHALAHAAAQSLAQGRTGASGFSDVQVGLTLLHDAVLHGTVGHPQLDGLDPAYRAVLVLERNKSGLIFDPARSPEELVAEAARLAAVTHPRTASVISLDALSSTTPVRVSTAPKPQRGPAVRPAALAGTFYDADPAELARTVETLFGHRGQESGVRSQDTRGSKEGSREAVLTPDPFPLTPASCPLTPEPWPAALVPHAGLRFSGRIAASVLQRIAIPQTVIVIGPKHTALGMDWAVAPHRTWALPGGSLESDVELVRQLCDAIPGLEMDAAAHEREHAIEVELPLLFRLAPRTKVVGIAIGHGDLESCRHFAQGLAKVLHDRLERPLLLISSDMNHFATDTENRRLDELALAALDRADPGEVYETVTRNQISMCGVVPAVMVLETLRLLGGENKAERVAYATSADVTGDTSRVVGYAGMLFR
jgi:AmmeMemoRadiSam system radical SAM enzyme/AmmeMemoRadiSam system protein B/AmmeMemoRadiSam system protein A